MEDFAHFWEILGIFGGQILGGSWGWITKFRYIKTRPVWGHGGQSEQSYVEGKLSQSHFYAGKLLRSRHLRAISGSSGRPFCAPFSLQGSWDLEEHDQISLVAKWRCCDVFLGFWTEIKKPPPQRQRPEDIGKSCAELRYQFSCYGLLSIISFQMCICVYGYHNSSLFLILSVSFSNG